MAKEAAQKVAPKAAAKPTPAAAPEKGGLATSYEVQIFRDKRWRIDSMFDDRALALFEAKRMSDSGRFVCVRVVAEYFDEDSGHTTLTTIYRGGRIEQAHQKDIEDAIKMRREIKLQEGITEKDVAAVAAKKAGKKKKTLWIAIGAGVFVVLAGVGAVLAL